jgi:predicted nucleic-acid-binding Zn-ribbon protein
MNDPWICNECGSKELASNVAEHDLRYIACIRCGGSEFHKASDLRNLLEVRREEMIDDAYQAARE